MPTPYVIPLITKVNASGYLMPANTPALLAPDNITHAQLRYSPFGTGQAVQGTFISGQNSSIEFSIPDLQVNEQFKLYLSEDGTNYDEDETFGGASGIKLFGTNDLSGLVTLADAQTISGVKTFSAKPKQNAYSAPTVDTEFAPKKYVDDLTPLSGKKMFFGIINQGATNAPVVTTFINTTGYTFTTARAAEGNYSITFSGGGASTNWFVHYARIQQNTSANVESFAYINVTKSGTNPILTIDTYQGEIQIVTENLRLLDSAVTTDTLLLNSPIIIIMP